MQPHVRTGSREVEALNIGSPSGHMTGPESMELARVEFLRMTLRLLGSWLQAGAPCNLSKGRNVVAVAADP